MALVWVQNKSHFWSNLNGPACEYEPVKEKLNVLVDHLTAGPWTVEHWDTYQGKIITTTQRTVGSAGRLELTLPGLASDTAFKLKLTPCQNLKVP